MSVYQAVQNGDYKNTLPYPDRVEVPAILRKVAKSPASTKISPKWCSDAPLFVIVYAVTHTKQVAAAAGSLAGTANKAFKDASK